MSEGGAGPAGIVSAIVGLCRGLRARGLLVTPAHAADAVRAFRELGLEGRRQAYFALRCVLTSAPEEFPIFDELFGRLFAAPQPARDDRPGGPREAPPTPGESGEARLLALESWLPRGTGDGEDGEEEQELPAASDREAQGTKDFASFGDAELEEIERIARRLARRLAARPSRRWEAARRGARVDLRRTVRKSLGNGAEPLELCFRRRKPRKTRIVALCDVSGSMDVYSRFLLQFLYGLQGSLARVETFVFATGLRRVTGLLRERPYASALRSLSAQVSDWSGGTRIGECLAAFDAGWERLVDARTVVVILSDGWDTGDPSQLGDELARLKRRSRRLVWLNPLLGSPGYEPLTQGMQAALPHLSVFAPVHNLASLRALERHLLA